MQLPSKATSTFAPKHGALPIQPTQLELATLMAPPVIGLARGGSAMQRPASAAGCRERARPAACRIDEPGGY
jgi:hypothetical protein